MTDTPTFPTDDVLYRFLLEEAGVRGALVRLGSSWREVASRADYPASLKSLLGESLAASALLTGNIKLEGTLSVEFKSSGPLRLLFTECADQGRLRGLARWHEPLPGSLDLGTMENALMAITIGSAERGQRYQGLVALDKPSLAQALEGYFTQSEQLPARILLVADGDHAVGLMLQKMPGEGGHGGVSDDDAWNRVNHLTDTLTLAELAATRPEELLFRLYHEENVRLFEPRMLAFGCSCSRERVQAMLRSLGREEVQAALDARDGEIEVICEFCAQRYTFDKVDAEQVLAADPAAVPAAPTRLQ